MAPRTDMIVWLDMEMTGLDITTCVPLEVAMVITNGNLEEQDSVEAAIWQPDSALALMSPFVRKMHTENGLLDRVRASDLSVDQAERALMLKLTRWCKYGEGVLAGNSIHNDRRFLARYFPAFESYLHYRMIDVSSLKELIRRWYGSNVLGSKPQDHTALADVRASIEELRRYRTSFFKPKDVTA